jgi:hypothetical protein
MGHPSQTVDPDWRGRGIIYRRTGNDAWKPLRKGLPDPQGLRIPIVAASSSEPGVFYCLTERMMRNGSGIDMSDRCQKDGLTT